MIENDRQRAAAEKQLEYLHHTLTGPPGSWLGGEQTRAQIMRLRKQVIEYDKNVAAQSVRAADQPGLL